MAISTTTTRQKIQRYLQTFDFEKLFINVLGWDYLKEPPLIISFENHTFTLRPLVEKRGVKVYMCNPDSQGNIPADSLLRKIEREVIKHAYEHIIIYTDREKTAQVWQWVKREQGKPSATRLHRYYKGQSGEGLAQRLEALVVVINEEDQLRTLEVMGRVTKAFDVERITKKFYDRFKLEHTAFLQFITGITAQGDREWYASLMLNRLMFIYFIQRKGFLDTKSPQALDGDTNYLANRLTWVKQQREDQSLTEAGGQGDREGRPYHTPGFHTFYRYFLLRLFHDGLSKREHAPELQALLGNIPYLNGGLFDLHTLESSYPHIDIPDAAFERLFTFFNEFDWHLDNRPLHKDNEINPDVLGYIFEKYINQKQMGAYYTKEDITGYISQNTIIPFIFDATGQKDLMAFRPDGSIWSLLREDPDKYIYDAVKKGCHKPLPPEIEAGVHDVARRGEWNKAAPEEYALPTEIWREVVARRIRYEEVRAKLAAGEIHSINDFITYNLDICKFAVDVITYCEGSNLLLAFYNAIESVTVLDPTCGSGAFLFAALNILEPLYEACLDHMQNQVDERDQLNASIPPAQRRRYPAIEQFRAILSEAEQHPRRKYFIYKSIIINNLYGVDIMEEATEICKLRLFLKLVSQVEKFDDIEPLPDIDFNIRAGNTLVGFASQDETRKALQGRTVGKGIARDSSAYQNQMVFDDRMDRIGQKAQEIERAFDNFRRIQTEFRQDGQDIAANKQQIRKMLKELGTELDGYLASEYGIDRNNIARKEVYDEKFKGWQESHQPFHWWIEFYGIMKKGGFDVIIGNPPYVEYSKVRNQYSIKGYHTESCGNLYTYMMERSLNLVILNGRSGLIMPVSLLCTERMIPLQMLILRSGQSWHSSFDIRPSQLFTGVSQRLTISLCVRGTNNNALYLGGYRRWDEKERDALQKMTTYINIKNNDFELGYVPKVATKTETSIINKLREANLLLSHLEREESEHPIYVHRIIRYFIKAVDFIPYFWNETEGRKKSEDYKPFFFKPDALFAIAATLNSTLFYWFWHTYSDGFHCGYRDVRAFSVGSLLESEALPTLQLLGQELMGELQKSTTRKTVYSKSSGRMEYDEFNPRTCLTTIRKIDRVLAQHYGFTDEELDFIINYDIKYRMGRDSGDEGEE